MSVTFEPNLGMEFWLAQPEVFYCIANDEHEIIVLSNDWRERVKTRDEFEAQYAAHANECEDCRIYQPQLRRREPEGFKAINLNNRNAALLLQLLGLAKMGDDGYPELSGMIPVDRLEEHLLLADAMDLAERSTPDADSANYFTERFDHLRQLVESARVLGADEITYA